jgi:phosphoribosylanthranilate isomerase
MLSGYNEIRCNFLIARSCVRVKICGITNEEDACLAASLGVDAIGLNFYARSPRCVSEETAARIVRALPPFVEPVGLFVNDPLDEVVERVRRLGFVRTIQWHGDRHELPPAGPYPIIPAFPVKDRDDLAVVTDYLEKCRQANCLPAAILVDGRVPGAYGGTGRNAPWELLAGFQPEVPLILAGGLTPENVAEAIRMVRPYGVDVASGVESTPTRKDAEKMRRFVDSVRDAAHRNRDAV